MPGILTYLKSLRGGDLDNDGFIQALTENRPAPYIPPPIPTAPEPLAPATLMEQIRLQVALWDAKPELLASYRMLARGHRHDSARQILIDLGNPRLIVVKNDATECFLFAAADPFKTPAKITVRSLLFVSPANVAVSRKLFREFPTGEAGTTFNFTLQIDANPGDAGATT